MNRLQLVTKIDILEWYDGLVSGIVHTAESVFFFYLLAFDSDLDKKKFAVLPLSAVDVTQIESAIRLGQTEAIESSLLPLRIDGKRMYWTNTEPETGQRLGLEEFGPGEIAEIDPPIFPCIDRAVTEAAIGRWLRD